MRYMAPEIAKNQPYNYSADVYSFGILLWEILSMERPFERYTCNMYLDLIVEKGHRPKCDESWPLPLRSLMSRCWQADWRKRPSCTEVVQVLRREVGKLRGGDDSGLGDVQRRSTSVLRKHSSSRMPASKCCLLFTAVGN